MSFPIVGKKEQVATKSCSSEPIDGNLQGRDVYQSVLNPVDGKRFRDLIEADQIKHLDYFDSSEEEEVSVMDTKLFEELKNCYGDNSSLDGVFAGLHAPDFGQKFRAFLAKEKARGR